MELSGVPSPALSLKHLPAHTKLCLSDGLWSLKAFWHRCSHGEARHATCPHSGAALKSPTTAKPNRPRHGRRGRSTAPRAPPLHLASPLSLHLTLRPSPTGHFRRAATGAAGGRPSTAPPQRPPALSRPGPAGPGGAGGGEVGSVRRMLGTSPSPAPPASPTRPLPVSREGSSRVSDQRPGGLGAAGLS